MDDCPDWLMPGCEENHDQLFDGQMLSTAKGTELLFFFLLPGFVNYFLSTVQ